jgi:hypothetical protein
MTTIFVCMPDEGVDVWRPVQATLEGGSIYRMEYAPVPETEMWEFPPGSRVRCEWRQLSDGPELVAIALA